MLPTMCQRVADTSWLWARLVIDAQRFRSQEANRRDALARLDELVRAAAHRPKSRIATKPTAASRRRRVEGKRVRAAVKRSRGRVSDTE